MRLVWMTISDFRSYRELRWTPHPGVNIISGPNASGKSNLLEAIGYLACLRSFRGAKDSVLIRQDAESAVVRGEIQTGADTTLIEVELSRDRARRAQLNGSRLARVADLSGKVSAIAFLPDDLALVKDGPALRRGLLDSVAVMLWPVAHRDQREYERALRQRNMLLRQMGRRTDPVTLDVWDERLSRAGGRLMERRMACVDTLATHTTEAYRDLSGGPGRVAIKYRSVWGGDSVKGREHWEGTLRDALAGSRSMDMDRRVSTVGLHRDHVDLMLDDRNSRTHASQGEQRTLTLALRLATHRAVEQKVGHSPVLILDDVFSELDRERCDALSRHLPEAQTFISSARQEDVSLPSGRRWTMNKSGLV